MGPLPYSQKPAFGSGMFIFLFFWGGGDCFSSFKFVFLMILSSVMVLFDDLSPVTVLFDDFVACYGSCNGLNIAKMLNDSYQNSRQPQMLWRESAKHNFLRPNHLKI